MRFSRTVAIVFDLFDQIKEWRSCFEGNGRDRWRFAMANCHSRRFFPDGLSKRIVFSLAMKSHSRNGERWHPCYGDLCREFLFCASQSDWIENQ
jgi:hypothetical protein